MVVTPPLFHALILLPYVLIYNIISCQRFFMDKLNFILKLGTSYFFVYNKYGANWAAEVKESSFFTRSFLKNVVKYLL